MNSKEISDFYDAFSTQQEKTGINARHRIIMRRLKQSGLKRNHNVLEIGCGIGTVTGLLSTFLREGKLTAIDISPKSIDVAKKKLASRKNLELLLGDLSEVSLDQKFDVVVLPDVIEHVPLKDHLMLFKNIREKIHNDSFVAINLPDPYYQEWLKVHKPKVLQIIDQPVYSNLLLENIYANDMHLNFLESYQLFTHDPIYQWIILKPNRQFRPGGPGKLVTAIQNFKTRID